MTKTEIFTLSKFSYSMVFAYFGLLLDNFLILSYGVLLVILFSVESAYDLIKGYKNASLRPANTKRIHMDIKR